MVVNPVSNGLLCVTEPASELDLIPFKTFLDFYQDSPILTAYIHGYATAEAYFISRCRQALVRDRHHILLFPINSAQDLGNLTLWIRRSTTQLCIDPLAESRRLDDLIFCPLEELAGKAAPWDVFSTPNPELTAIRHLSLAQYHQICYGLGRYRLRTLPSVYVTTPPGEVIPWAPEGCFENFEVLARVPDGQPFGHIGKPALHWDQWAWSVSQPEVSAMPNSFLRYISIPWSTFLGIQVPDSDAAAYLGTGADAWLSQANHIFCNAGITDRLEDFGGLIPHTFPVVTKHSSKVLVERIFFTIKVHVTAKVASPGYLFLCPPNNFQDGPMSFRWPECPAYWSLDPLGVERLSAEEAARLGFPPLLLITKIEGVLGC
ncbi:hypothetical protein C8R46DRAFT_1048165 [Mycena filopes]|nr:hypothetical protein C8R46DRAFT_1048165 [Mycena filopes]